jgi:hypothetical protein
MNPLRKFELNETRRHFFGRSATGIGTAALASLLNPELFGATAPSLSTANTTGGIPGIPHFAPKAKRIIYLFMSGAPSQLDMWDYKPKMNDWFDKELPDSVRNGQRITTMTSGQKRFPIVPSTFKFQQHGEHGAWVSELLPYTAGIVDELAVIKTVNTEAINHDPAITYIQTGSQLPGRPSSGAWLSYGLGSMNENLPGFVVLHSTVNGGFGGQALYARLWGAGFLSTRHQGVSLRSVGDPVLYLSNPDGMSARLRRRMLDELAVLNEEHFRDVGDPEIQSRIAQYEMAYRMQTSVPELTDISDEPENVLNMYGPDVKTPGTFAANCLLARRLAERDVRFIQLFHRGWDHHSGLPTHLRGQARDVDQPIAGLLKDLKQRGLLEDTLVVFAGEFGRTTFAQGARDRNSYGRDHHPRCFTTWMAGGGIKGGISYGETDDFCYNVTKDPVHIRDFHATMLHQLGIDHKRLTFPYQGLNQRLTGVEPSRVVKDILS